MNFAIGAIEVFAEQGPFISTTSISLGSKQ
jgi:hypothetical protein